MSSEPNDPNDEFNALQEKALRDDFKPQPDGRCPCGSGQYGYNLFDTKGQLLLYCCYSCEKQRRERG